jgi:hypothetical protein
VGEAPAEPEARAGEKKSRACAGRLPTGSVFFYRRRSHRPEHPSHEVATPTRLPQHIPVPVVETPMVESKVPDRSRPLARVSQVVRPAEEKAGRPSFWVRFLGALVQALAVPAV